MLDNNTWNHLKIGKQMSFSLVGIYGISTIVGY